MVVKTNYLANLESVKGNYCYYYSSEGKLEKQPYQIQKVRLVSRAEPREVRVAPSAVQRRSTIARLFCVKVAECSGFNMLIITPFLSSVKWYKLLGGTPPDSLQNLVELASVVGFGLRLSALIGTIEKGGNYFIQGKQFECCFSVGDLFSSMGSIAKELSRRKIIVLAAESLPLINGFGVGWALFKQGRTLIIELKQLNDPNLSNEKCFLIALKVTKCSLIILAQTMIATTMVFGIAYPGVVVLSFSTASQVCSMAILFYEKTVIASLVEREQRQIAI